MYFLFYSLLFFSVIAQSLKAQTVNDYWWYSTSDNILNNAGGFLGTLGWTSVTSSQWGRNSG